MEGRSERADLEKLAAAFFANIGRGNCEYGGIGLDDKRPFGNSYVTGDIADIVGLEPHDKELGLTRDEEEYLDGLYDKLPDYLRSWWSAVMESAKPGQDT